MADESGGGGIDAVFSSIAIRLEHLLRNLILSGTASIDGGGNRLANRIVGNDGGNTLHGGDGRDTLFGVAGNDALNGGGDRDTLYGGLGADTLIGGGGNDVFVFDTALGGGSVDRIVSFKNSSGNNDRIWLDESVFRKLAKGDLKSQHFCAGSKAKDANDWIVYNEKTGALLYDPDGSGSKDAIKFAVVENKPTLTYADFLVIA